MKRNRKIAYIVLIALIMFPTIVFAIKIPDPLNVDNPSEVTARIIRGFLGIVGSFALLNFVIAGVGIISSRGNSEKIQKHRENLMWTSIGIVLVFGAYAIIAYVINSLSGAFGIGST